MRRDVAVLPPDERPSIAICPACGGELVLIRVEEGGRRARYRHTPPSECPGAEVV